MRVRCGVMPLLDDLRTLSDQIRKRREHVKGEEATKHSLVLPFLHTIGYDVYDPTLVRPEFTADFAKKKSNGQMEKVDYALVFNGQPAIFIECKSVEKDPGMHDDQLARYFNSVQTAKVAVITNGLVYRFFTDLRATNVMDDTPFFEFNVLEFTERDVDNLSRYTSDAFSVEAVQGHAEELIFIAKVTPLIETILRSPPESFIRYLLDEAQIVSTRVTAKVVEKFQPIVKKATQTALLEIMAKGIRQEISPPTPPPPIVTTSPDLSPVPPSAESSENRVVTTEEELAIFERVTKACAGSTAKAPVQYKDTVAYFGVNIHGKVTRWFLRVFTNGEKKSVVLRLPFDKIGPLAAGFQVEKVPETSGGTGRVYFAAAEDFDKFAGLVVAAYEHEVGRKDSGDGD